MLVMAWIRKSLLIILSAISWLTIFSDVCWVIILSGAFYELWQLLNKSLILTYFETNPFILPKFLQKHRIFIFRSHSMLPDVILEKTVKTAHSGQLKSACDCVDSDYQLRKQDICYLFFLEGFVLEQVNNLGQKFSASELVHVQVTIDLHEWVLHCFENDGSLPEEAARSNQMIDLQQLTVGIILANVFDAWAAFEK